MSKFHILFWIFEWLNKCHPEVLEQMEQEFYGHRQNDLATQNISTQLKERLKAWRKARKDDPV